ncbi:hypothetical protein EXT68_16890 [Pectobacterium parmentieri]|nr:hypothetical protein [Pectobacterium parmentieri]MBI0496142.1 hypothetical protein [Pectobacterium parmentieri]MBI0557516.1 hypothetical protein [Pectobacterium parmentieri]MBI0570669.1 hypothetical protein [Pectobacterium parmentieri]MBI0575374.1 hypothetical protein [Pectobacterium parmentieri]
MLDYIHDKSTDYLLFNEGVSLDGFDLKLIYKAKSKSIFNKIKKFHMLFTTGPELVSRELRSVLECVVPAEIEFFDAEVIYGNERLNGFSVINVIRKINCCNMEESEYELTNFDPNNPTYIFLYTVLLDEIPCNFNVVRCSEQPTSIVVSAEIKSAISNAGLKGITFCKAIDVTYKERTICEKI